MVQFFRRDTYTKVFNTDSDPIGFGYQVNLDPFTVRRISESISQQVNEHLFDAVGIPADQVGFKGAVYIDLVVIVSMGQLYSTFCIGVSNILIIWYANVLNNT